MANRHLTAYWHSAAKLHLLNQRIFPRAQLPAARFIPFSQIKKGWLDNGVGEQQEVYVAPFCFRSGDELSIPIWLEATLSEAGALAPKKQGALPWVLPTFLDSLSPKLPILGSVHAHDALLSEYFGSPDKPYLFESWIEYYTQCIAFLSELHPNWQQEFIQTGFDLFDNAIVLPISSIPMHSPVRMDNIQLDFCANTLINTEANTEANTNLFIPGEISWLKTSLLALAGLESGACLGISHDNKKNTLSLFLKEFVQYLWVDRALKQSEASALPALPSIACVLPIYIKNNNNIIFDWAGESVNQTPDALKTRFQAYFSEDIFTPDQLTPAYMAAYSHECLISAKKQYQDGLALIQAYQHQLLKQQELENNIHALTEQDVILEQRYQSVLNAQKALLSEGSSRHFLGKVWQKFAQSKSTHYLNSMPVLAQHLDLQEIEKAEIKNSENALVWLGESLRKIQVERTKLHANLVNLNEALSERQSLWRDLLSWQAPHKLSLFCDQTKPIILTPIHDYFIQKLRALANLYWSAKTPKQEVNLEIIYQDPHQLFDRSKNTKNTQNKKIDYLFVFEANHFSPMLGGEFFSQGDRVIAFSGSKSRRFPVLTPLQDTCLVHRHQLTTDYPESLLEESGALVSTGDAFQLINLHHAYEDPAYLGTGSPQLLFLQSPDISSDQVQELSIVFHPIVGQMVPDRGSFINIPEAEYILNWLVSQNQTQDQNQTQVILTLFAAQKKQLQKLVENAGLSIPVYTLSEAIGKKANSVIISMVNTGEILGPSIYDQNPALLSEMHHIASQRVEIFADPSIFSLSHTTLGKFANTVFTRRPEQKKDILFASSL